MGEGRNLRRGDVKNAKGIRRILLREVGWDGGSTDSGVIDIGMEY